MVGTIGRCAECRETYGDDCVACTICQAPPHEVCAHCPPSLILSAD